MSIKFCLFKALYLFSSTSNLFKYMLCFAESWCFPVILDWIRFNKLLGETGLRLRSKLRLQYSGRLNWLREKRFGSTVNIEAIFNLSQYELSRAQLEVLSRGPNFSIPPISVNKDEIFSEFGMYFSQLQPLLPDTPSARDIESTLKAKLVSLAHEYMLGRSKITLNFRLERSTCLHYANCVRMIIL